MWETVSIVCTEMMSPWQTIHMVDNHLISQPLVPCSLGFRLARMPSMKTRHPTHEASPCVHHTLSQVQSHITSKEEW